MGKCAATNMERKSCDFYKKGKCLNNNDCLLKRLDIPEVKQASIRDNSGTSPFGPDVNYYGSYENSDGSAWVTPDKK